MRAPSALVALHAAVALFGFAALFGKWIALSPIAIVFGRTIVAAALLAAVVAATRKTKWRPTSSLVVNGLLLVFHWVAFFAAVQVSTVAIALLGFASFPVFVLAIECAVDRRTPNISELMAVMLVIAGLAVLVPDFAWSSTIVQGLAYGTLAGFTFALLALRNRKLVAQADATNLALWQNAFGSLWLAPVILWNASQMAPTPRELMLILVLGVLCTALAHSLFIASLRHVSAHTASVVAILEPVYGIALGVALLGERLDPRTVAGGALIIVAALLATLRAGAKLRA
jgi:drug/metabolite transporter (DMT)-like permease